MNASSTEVKTLNEQIEQQKKKNNVSNRNRFFSTMNSGEKFVLFGIGKRGEYRMFFSFPRATMFR